MHCYATRLARRVPLLGVSAMSHDLVLPTPEQFSAFPYDPPYSIQTDLMKHVYSSIERRRVTIVESPTGTVRAE